MIELYFSPGACSFVPHVALEIVRATTGEAFELKLVKFHKGEQKTPEYLALNPDGLVPVLMVDGRPLTQIVAICDYLDRRYPQVGFLPTDTWARAQALSQLAWMNNTVHPCFTHVFMPEKFADDDAARAEVRRVATDAYRKYLERIEAWARSANPFWFGDRPSFHDAYSVTLLRWGGLAGIDPESLPVLKALVERVAAAAPVAAAIERERIRVDTYRKA